MKPTKDKCTIDGVGKIAYGALGMVYSVWCMMRGVRCMVYVAWCILHDACVWCVKCFVWCVVLRIWCIMYAAWCMVCVVYGVRSLSVIWFLFVLCMVDPKSEKGKLVGYSYQECMRNHYHWYRLICFKKKRDVSTFHLSMQNYRSLVYSTSIDLDW